MTLRKNIEELTKDLKGRIQYYESCKKDIGDSRALGYYQGRIDAYNYAISMLEIALRFSSDK